MAVPEYPALVVIGPNRKIDGLIWRKVRVPNGSDGWIAASFLTPSQ